MFNIDWTQEVPKVVRQKMQEIWINLGQYYSKPLVGHTCPVCLEFMLIGERHLTCKMHLNPEQTCIVCGRDDRKGIHAKCQIELRKMRKEVIEIFRRSM